MAPCGSIAFRQCGQEKAPGLDTRDLEPRPALVGLRGSEESHCHLAPVFSSANWD